MEQTKVENNIHDFEVYLSNMKDHDMENLIFQGIKLNKTNNI